MNRIDVDNAVVYACEVIRNQGYDVDWKLTNVNCFKPIGAQKQYSHPKLTVYSYLGKRKTRVGENESSNRLEIVDFHPEDRDVIVYPFLGRRRLEAAFEVIKGSKPRTHMLQYILPKVAFHLRRDIDENHYSQLAIMLLTAEQVFLKASAVSRTNKEIIMPDRVVMPFLDMVWTEEMSGLVMPSLGLNSDLLSPIRTHAP